MRIKKMISKRLRSASDMTPFKFCANVKLLGKVETTFGLTYHVTIQFPVDTSDCASWIKMCYRVTGKLKTFFRQFRLMDSKEFHLQFYLSSYPIIFSGPRCISHEPLLGLAAVTTVVRAGKVHTMPALAMDTVCCSIASSNACWSEPILSNLGGS